MLTNDLEEHALHLQGLAAHWIATPSRRLLHNIINCLPGDGIVSHNT
jgi:hypothetical protein